MVNDPRYVEWRGLDILLLGLSKTEEDLARMIREMEDRKRLSSAMNLDAWATAYVEVTGTASVDWLRHWYFREAGRTRDELRDILRALSVQVANTPGLHDPAVAAYRDLLANHPFAAPDIKRDLIAWQKWDLSQLLRHVQGQIAKNDPLGAYAVELYLQRAAAHNRPTKE